MTRHLNRRKILPVLLLVALAAAPARTQADPDEPWRPLAQNSFHHGFGLIRAGIRHTLYIAYSSEGTDLVVAPVAANGLPGPQQTLVQDFSSVNEVVGIPAARGVRFFFSGQQSEG